ncbi:Glutamate--tRNA ligase mitochondrial [Cytospora paraplurivora]
MLMDSDHAFRCFCSKEDLEFNLRQATSSGATAHYPGTCTGISRSESDRRAANGEPHIIRFKSSETPVSAPDLVYGAYKKAEREDNFIIMKSDGFPTYHFANVVDDHFMKITHVIRGAEWLISTPKHVELYNAFGWQPPNFAHVGLLVDHQRQKLSKRDIDNIGISVFRDTNILPEALLNFSVLLGWDPGLQNKPHLDKRGRMTLDEMKQNFSLKFTRGDIVVDLVKLKYFQNRFIRDLISGAVADPVALSKRILKPIQDELLRLDEKLTEEEYEDSVAALDQLNSISHLTLRRAHDRGEEYIHEVLKAWKGPIDDHSQFVRDNLYAFWAPSRAAYRESFPEFQDGMRRIKLTKQLKAIENTDISRVLKYFRDRLEEIPEEGWEPEAVGNRTKELADAVEYYDTKKDQLMDHGAGWKFLRWALFNGMSGQSVVPMMLLLGREETFRRLREARKIAVKGEEQAAAAAKAKEIELERSRVRIAYLGNPLAEDPDKAQEVEAKEPRNVKVAITNDEHKKIPSKTEHFLRPMHDDRQQYGPFVSRPPIRKYHLDEEPPVQFLEPKEHETGFRHLVVNNIPDSSYAPPLWQVIERRKRAALDRLEYESRASSCLPGEGDTRRESPPHSRPNGRNSSSSPLGRPRPFLKPVHPENGMGSEETMARAIPRGPFILGEPIVDVKAHVQRLEAQNEEKRIKADKKLRRDRLKLMRPDLRLPASSGIPRTVLESGLGPLYAGEVVYNPLRAQPQIAAAHAEALENERQVRKELEKEENITMADAEKQLQRSWVERRDQ